MKLLTSLIIIFLTRFRKIMRITRVGGGHRLPIKITHNLTPHQNKPNLIKGSLRNKFMFYKIYQIKFH